MTDTHDGPSPSPMDVEVAASRWAEVFTRLSSDGVPTFQRLARLTTEDVRFVDPFNELRGREPLLALLRHTLAQVDDLVFEVLDIAVSGPTAYLRWRMTGRIPVIGDWNVTGVSEVRFNADLRVAAHIDHWDAASQFYTRLPLIGRLLRWIAARAGPPVD